MATSRYGTGTGATDSRTGTIGSSTGTQTQSSSSNSSATSTQNGTSTTSTKNMSSGDKAILDRLIQQLMNGGTADMQEQQATRDAETRTVQGIRSGYSKDAAFNDAQGLMALQMRRTMEQLLPSINRAAESAGSSGGALRALLLQDVAQRASESSSALGAQQAVSYGGISANLSQVLENLTKVNPQAAELLVSALNIAKGANTTATTVSSQVGTNNSTQQTTGTQNTTNNTTQQQSTDYAPFAVTGGSTTPIYYGPTETGTQGTGIGSTLDTLRQLAGDNAWSGYQL